MFSNRVTIREGLPAPSDKSCVDFMQIKKRGDKSIEQTV